MGTSHTDEYASLTEVFTDPRIGWMLEYGVRGVTEPQATDARESPWPSATIWYVLETTIARNSHKWVVSQGRTTDLLSTYRIREVALVPFLTLDDLMEGIRHHRSGPTPVIAYRATNRETGQTLMIPGR